jgi:membrane associated rhomboid family serine protease
MLKHAVPGIIGANVAVFAAWQFADTPSRRKFMFKNFTMSSDGVIHQHRYHTLLTSMFSHKDIFHLSSNMITFYFFSTNVLYSLGSQRFIQLYIGGGLFSGLTLILWPYSVPRTWPARYKVNTYSPALGASGAVNAIVMYSILSAPREIILVNFLLPLPAALFGGLFILKDSYELYHGGGNIGNAAHLGGAFFGASVFALKRFRRFR